MKKLATFVLMLIILVINNTILFSDSPELKEAVRITEMKIIGEPFKDEKVILSVEFISFVNIETNIKLIFSNLIKPANYFGQENFVEETQRINKNQSYRKEFELEIKDIGYSIITFAIWIEELQGYNNGASRYLSFEINESDYFIFDERSDGIEIQPLIINTQRETKVRETDALYIVSVSGNVKFFDSHQGANKGLYGNTVELWFRNSNNPNNWYHPVYSPNCTGNQHVHYDIVDVNGSYNFNFSFNGDLSNYNQVLVIVSRANSASYMPVQQNGITTWCDNSYRHWFSLSEGFIGNINGSNTNITVDNANCEVNSKDGEIFRNMMFSREFVIQRYNGSLTFPLPTIFVNRLDLPQGIAGWFISGGGGIIPRIEIDHSSTELTTTSHEFGHYVNYKMWGNFLIGNNGCSDEIGNTIPGTGRIYKEGWAINYSFCTRNYANKVYGDNLRSWDDNTETAAYETPRFNNIRYTSIDPEISAHACYLWNLYDDYNNGIFESNIYLGDNDDISERSVRVFETMRTPIMDCASKFNNRFKNGLTSEEQTSVQDIYTFMFLNANHNPRSAQISNASAQVISSNQIRFQWSSQSYLSNFYRNYESGYRIYKKANGVWQLIHTASAGTTNYTYTTTQNYGEFKITSYNQRGDSYGAPIINVPVVAPVIYDFTQSPNPLYRGSNGTVTCNLSQGNGNLSYNWSIVSGNTGFSISNDTLKTVSIHYSNTDAISNPNTRYNSYENNSAIEGPGGAMLQCSVWNSAGSFIANAFVNLANTSHGCPFVYTWNGQEWIEDNNILPQSQQPDLLGQDVTDYYQLFTKPVLEDEKYYLAIGEFEEEISYLDQIKLLVIDHPKETFVTVNDEGQIIQFAKPAYFASAQLDSADVIKMLYELDNITVEASEGDTLYLTFDDINTTAEPWILIVGQSHPIYKDKITGRILNKERESFTSFRLRRNPTYNWVLAPTTGSSTLDVQIAWEHAASIDYTDVCHKLELPSTVYQAQLEIAEHNLLGDVTTLLYTIDEEYIELNKDEFVTLTYAAPQVDENMERTFVLVSRGRYERQTNKMSKPTTIEDEIILPKETKLYDNYPNPFNPSTIINYSLKDAGMVSIKVYDILGSEVATLVNETKPAGTYQVEFNASQLPSGVYIYRMQAGSYTASKKMLLVK